MNLAALLCLALSGLADWCLASAPGNAHPVTSVGDLRHLHSRGPTSQCEPFSISFQSSRVSEIDGSFVAISPPGSYELDSEGLKLFLDRPHGKITTKGNVNDRIADGATVNSTFTLLFV